MPEGRPKPPKPGPEKGWDERLEAACEVRGILTREGLVFDEATESVGDAAAWELEGD